jgi:hypothetical protein
MLLHLHLWQRLLIATMSQQPILQTTVLSKIRFDTTYIYTYLLTNAITRTCQQRLFEPRRQLNASQQIYKSIHTHTINKTQQTNKATNKTNTSESGWLCFDAGDQQATGELRRLSGVAQRLMLTNALVVCLIQLSFYTNNNNISTSIFKE